MSEIRKPAGFRWHSSDFWRKGNLLRCQHCGKQTDESAPEDARHSSFCEKYERGAIVRGPDLPAPSEAAEHEHPIDAVLRSISKAEKPEKSAVWEEWCRQGPCVNCNKPPRSTVSHEPSGAPVQGRGVSQKVRDTLGTSKCWEPCHRVLTATGCLPDPRDSERKGKIVLRSKAETERLIHDAQEERLRNALERFPQEWRIEILSKGIACVPEGVKRRALMGDVDDRLADALDHAGDEL